MELFYSDQRGANKIILDQEESHHCMKVLRHRTGDELIVTDGRGKLFRATLISDDKKECELDILEVIREEKESSPRIHIAIAPTKNADRFEMFIEKATEIGVNLITPIICHRSERDRIKADRLKKILVSSMKQSLRLWLPRLAETVKLKDLLTGEQKVSNPESNIPDQKFICHCQAEHLPSLKSLYQVKRNVTILIGPEGDFTSEEINLAGEKGFVSVSLGNARLRTETAGIIAVHTIQLLNE
jgi:16S rRNA (uracil1498-N3)-methyltransferase